MLFIKAVGLHSPCCFVMFHFSLQNQAELAFKLHTVFICTPNVHENITLCQASKWRLAAPNSTFTVQLNLCYLMSLYMLHLCPGSESAISFLLTWEESHHVLCYFLLTCPEATDPQWHLCALFIINVLGFLFKTGEFFHAMMEAKPFLCKESPAQQCESWSFAQLHSSDFPRQSWSHSTELACLSKCLLP